MRNWIARMFGFDVQITVLERRIYDLKEESRNSNRMLQERLSDLRNANNLLVEQLQNVRRRPEDMPLMISNTRESWPRLKKRLEEKSKIQAEWLNKGAEHVNESTSERESIEA